MQTRLSRLDGERGELLVAGFRVEDLVRRLALSFEELLFLLWRDRLPRPAEREEFLQRLRGAGGLPESLGRFLDEGARRGVPTIDLLRAGSAALSLEPDFAPTAWTPLPGAEDLSELRLRREAEALRCVACYPEILARILATRSGHRAPSPTDLPAELDHAGRFLALATGELPDPRDARALNLYWTVVAEHGLNPSSFAARVIVATRSDMFSAVTGALGALKGPRHGGAPGPALEMVREIGSSDRAEEFLQTKLDRGERLMGFGHRLYRVRDPRAELLAQAARELHDAPERRNFYELALRVEEVALRLLRERRPGRPPLQTNVEYYTGLLLHGLGFASEHFTPLFALGRIAGWTAHALEQLDERTLRPDAIYVGAENRAAQIPD